ncbi:MAG: hypothetical protein AAF628_27960 [Planctomycetota bacterium]
MIAEVERIELASVAQYSVLFWLLTVIGIALGAVLYAGLRYPWMRHPALRSSGPASPRVSWACGVTLASAFAAFAYGNAWMAFFALEVDGDRMWLVYQYPERRVELQRDDVREVRRRLSTDRFRHSSVVLVTDDGRFESVPLDRDRGDALQAAFARWRAAPN